MTGSTIVMDLRCLQDRGFAERGIGRHVLSALRLAREVSGFARAARLVGIVSPELADLPGEVACLLDECRPNAYLPELAAGSVFLNPSPMTHDQLFIARLLLRRDIRKAAMVYDFIPFEQPGTYLPAGVPRLNYFTALAWLNQYDFFLPISAATQARLQGLLRAGGRPSAVTGVPIAPWLERRHRAGRPLHLFTLAGHDPRKNPEIVIRAHAGSRLLQGRRIKLVIGGHYPAGAAEGFQSLARAAGGDPALVAVPGRVADEALHELYLDAFAVVTPSRAEGFSLPVIEAMAAGVASVASDIEAHAASVRDEALRFAPDDAAGLAGILERLVADEGYRAGVVRAQGEIWPAYRAAAVADKIWSALEELGAGLGKPLIGGARPVVALLSPLPPAHSGVADYSAACARALAARARLSLFSPTAGALPVGGMAVAPLSDLPFLRRKYDRIVSVVGNSEHHYDIFDRMRRFGSACICHDSRLLHFYAYRNGYQAAAEVAARELGRKVRAGEVERWIEDEASREVYFFGEIAAAARPLIFHARPSVAAARARYGVAARHLPFAIYRPWSAAQLTPAERQAAKARLRLDPAEIHIASFGFLSPVKAFGPALEALRILRRTHPGARLHWVGDPDIHAARFLQDAARLGLTANVTMTPKFLPPGVYADYLRAADLGLQLRKAGHGNISGALQDCIAAGLPSVANQDLADMLEAPDYVRRVSDEIVPAEIAAALAGLIERRDAALEPQRQAYCEAHSMERYAKSLLEILAL